MDLFHQHTFAEFMVWMGNYTFCFVVGWNYLSMPNFNDDLSKLSFTNNRNLFVMDTQIKCNDATLIFNVALIPKALCSNWLVDVPSVCELNNRTGKPERDLAQQHLAQQY